MENISVDQAVRATYGRYFHRLLTRPDWVNRRIISIELIDEERSRRRVSIDIDVSKIRAYAAEVGLDPMGWLPVPLGVLHKEILLDFSATSQDGTLLPVEVSGNNSEVWKDALLHTLRTAPEYRDFVAQFGDESEIALSALGEDITRVVGPITACERLRISEVSMGLRSTFTLQAAIEAYLCRIDESHSSEDELRSVDLWSRFGITRISAWDQIFDTSRLGHAQEQGVSFVELLKCAILSFIPVVKICPDPAARETIVKYDFQMAATRTPLRTQYDFYRARVREHITEREYKSQARMRLPRRLGWNLIRGVGWFAGTATIGIRWTLEVLGFFALPVVLDTAMVTHAAREHLKVTCPDGVYAARLNYWPGANFDSIDTHRSRYAAIIKRVTRDRAILYHRSFRPVFDPALRCRIIARMRPRLTNFSTTAAVAIAISTTLTWLCWKFPNVVVADGSGNVGALSILLLLSSSFTSVYATYQGEHRRRSLMLTLPRLAVAVSGIAPAVIAVTALFFGVNVNREDYDSRDEYREAVAAATAEAAKQVEDTSRWWLVLCVIVCGYFVMFLLIGLTSRAITLFGKEANTDVLKRLRRQYMRQRTAPQVRNSGLRSSGAISRLLWHWLHLIYGLYDFYDGTLDHVTSRPNVVKQGWRRSVDHARSEGEGPIR